MRTQYYYDINLLLKNLKCLTYEKTNMMSNWQLIRSNTI